MGIEIERKFLLRDDGWRRLVVRKLDIAQGYLAGGERASVRVRLAGGRAWLNVKSGGLVARRLEFEYAVPPAEARQMLAELCASGLIEKTRHFVPYERFEWEIDEFHGANTGLVVAEIELEHENDDFPRPEWLGAEVTYLPRYYNVNLVTHAYEDWSDSERDPSA